MFLLYLMCFTAADNIGVITVASASFIQCPASTVAPPHGPSTRRYATLWLTTVRDSRTKSTSSATFITGNASAGDAKPRISPGITIARTGLVATTWAGNSTSGISARIASPGISAARSAGTGISTGSGNIADAGHVADYDGSRSVFLYLC